MAVSYAAEISAENCLLCRFGFRRDPLIVWYFAFGTQHVTSSIGARPPGHESRPNLLGRTLLCAEPGRTTFVGCGFCLPRDFDGGVVRDSISVTFFGWASCPFFSMTSGWSTSREMLPKIEARTTPPSESRGRQSQQPTHSVRPSTERRSVSPQNVWSRLVSWGPSTD